MARIKNRWKGLAFTADTNCGISYQAGFDTANCPDYPNTLLKESEIDNLNASGLGGLLGPVGAALSINKAKNTAQKLYNEALGNIRKVFPGPGSCPTGTESLSVYRGKGTWAKAVCGNSCGYIQQAIADMRTTLNDWHIPRGEQNYIAAYNVVIQEYTDYYNANCISATPPVQTTAGAGAQTVADAGAAASQQPAATTTNSATTAGGASTTTQPTIDGQPLIDQAKKIPSWVWWVAGGLVGLVVIVKVARG